MGGTPVKDNPRFGLDAVSKQQARMAEAIKPRSKREETGPFERLLISLPWLIVAIVWALVAWLK